MNWAGNLCAKEKLCLTLYYKIQNNRLVELSNGYDFEYVAY